MVVVGWLDASWLAGLSAYLEEGKRAGIHTYTRREVRRGGAVGVGKVNLKAMCGVWCGGS